MKKELKDKLVQFVLGIGGGLLVVVVSLFMLASPGGQDVGKLDVYHNRYTHYIASRLLLQNAAVLDFRTNGSGETINSSATDQLDIDATTEVEIATGLLDLNGNLDVSGTSTLTGAVGANGINPDAADGAAIGTTALEWSDLYLADGGIINFQNDQSVTMTGAAGGVVFSGSPTFATSILPDAADGSVIGSATLEWSDFFLADGGVMNLGNDQDVTITHVPDAGVLVNSTRYISFGDAGSKIAQLSDGKLDIASDGTGQDDITLSGTVAMGAIMGWKKGGDVATIADAFTLGDDGNYFDITGTTGIDSIAAKTAGTVVMLQFDTTPTVSDGGNLKMAGDLVATADDILVLVCDGTNWFEISRAVN